MLNVITEFGELTSLAILAYGALLCFKHSELFQEMTEQALSACKPGRVGNLERGELNISI